MCYTCSPECDNCFAKFVVCPSCGHIEMLARNSCTQCGCPISQEAKEEARAAWASGTRFSQRRKSRNLFVERMIAAGRIPSRYNKPHSKGAS